MTSEQRSRSVLCVREAGKCNKVFISVEWHTLDCTVRQSQVVSSSEYHKSFLSRDCFFVVVHDHHGSITVLHRIVTLQYRIVGTLNPSVGALGVQLTRLSRSGRRKHHALLVSLRLSPPLQTIPRHSRRSRPLAHRPLPPSSPTAPFERPKTIQSPISELCGNSVGARETVLTCLRAVVPTPPPTTMTNMTYSPSSTPSGSPLPFTLWGLPRDPRTDFSVPCTLDTH